MQELELGPRELEALVAAVYPECLPSEFRHFQVHRNSLHRLETPAHSLHVVSYQRDSLKTAAGRWWDGTADSSAGDAVVLHCLVSFSQKQDSSKTEVCQQGRNMLMQ